jgi:hypothetical protein
MGESRREYSLEAVLSVRERCRDAPNGQKVKAAMEEALAELRVAQAQPPPPAPCIVQQPDARQRPGNPGLAPSGLGAGPGMARPGQCVPPGRRDAVPMPVSCAPALLLRCACAADTSNAHRDGRLAWRAGGAKRGAPWQRLRGRAGGAYLCPAGINGGAPWQRLRGRAGRAHLCPAGINGGAPWQRLRGRAGGGRLLREQVSQRLRWGVPW